MQSAEELIDTSVSAAFELLGKNAVLFEIDVHEQTITHQFGIYLRERFPGWDVDCEYNREGRVVKRLPPMPSENVLDIPDEHGDLIKPDIIVHRRTIRENLLVVEVEKAGNDDHSEDDRKLRGMTDSEGPFGYDLGIHFVFDCAQGMIADLRCYIDGAPNEGLTTIAHRAIAARL